MLDELRIRHLGVIEDAEVVVDPGLTVLTGETGAGKTLIVTALQLMVGGRGDSSLVRTGSDEAVVESRWIPAPSGVLAWRLDADDGDEMAHDDWAGETVVSRRVGANGRSRVRIDGQLATVGALVAGLAPHVEIHAQDTHRRLLQPATQRRLLDAWAGKEHLTDIATHVAAHGAHTSALANRDELASSATRRARELDQLARETAEIDAVALVDDDGDLDVRIDELTHADELRHWLSEAATAVGFDGALDGLGTAVAAMRRLPTTTTATDELHQRLDEVVALATDLADGLRAATEAIDADPTALDRAQARLSQVRSLTRKYGPSQGDVVLHREQAGARYRHLVGLEADGSAVEDAVVATHEAMVATAAVVTAGRHAAAGRLAEAVAGHLADLGLGHARFTVDVTSGPMTSHGSDDVSFRLAANPGQPPADLAMAASGGERSRVALALEAALADVGDVDVLVFDEVDAGVGGATAMKVGEKLAMLARGGRQVLCVTHLAQLAVWADRHFVVDKAVTADTTRTSVRRVADDGRVAELARMLGGDTTEAALAHAAELLEEATVSRDSSRLRP